jgi:Xaa-Pro dipeptidase
MITSPVFPPEELQTRLGQFRQRVAERDIEAALITKPENIYYLTGLNHQGFFAYHGLVVPVEGELLLIARAMERVTVENQLGDIEFIGYEDGADPARITRQALARAGLEAARLGLEESSLFLTPRIAGDLRVTMPQAHWRDISGLVDELRLVKSSRELVYMRQAANVTDVMMRTALEVARAGVSEREIAAEVHRAMILAGGEYPGFTPFIRTTPRLGEEHTTWSDRVLQSGDTLFLEMAGCVARYHAPLGRLVFVDTVPAGAAAMAVVCQEAFQRVVEAIRPGVTAAQVYRAWQDRVDEADLAHYRRHHCGYLVGIGFPPSWVGGSMVTGLRHDSPLKLEVGMTFHLLSWLVGAGQGDYFVSDAAVLTEKGCERLTTLSQEIQTV